MAGKGLGRGLTSLFGEESFDKSVSETSRLPLSKIQPNSNQPREDFDQDALAELADSISKHGLITPIAVRKLSSGDYQIIAGERRWRAARIAGLSEVPVVVLEADDRRVMELALIENLQREQLNPLEEARGYKTLIEDFGLTQEEVAGRVGKSRPAVANALRLLSLPDSIKERLKDGKLSEGHARVLLSLDDEKDMLDAARKIENMNLSVRQTESYVKKLKAGVGQSPHPAKEVQVDYTADFARRLSDSLGRKVNLTYGKKKGKIELEYYGLDDLDELVRRFERAFKS